MGAYHGALEASKRARALETFSAEAAVDRVLVCTDRAARGVDFRNRPVDHVVLYDWPKDPAEYVRRIGRTCRAGRGGRVTVLAFGKQLPLARASMGGGKGGVVDVYIAPEDGEGQEGEWDGKKRGRGAARKQKKGTFTQIDDGALWDAR